jgi:hypothetical protein
MNSLAEVLYIIGLFVLRLGVPALIILTIAYFLRRLDARWEQEARLEQEAGRVTRKVVEQKDVFPTLPHSPLPQPLLAAFDSYGKPCWEIKDCDPIAVEQCPAHQNPNMSCWQARREAEGKIPLECYHCELFLLAIQSSELHQMSQELPH